MNILYCGAHAILEYDEVKLFDRIGHSVFSIGSYIHPSRPMDNARPPLDVPEHPELIAAVDALGQSNHPAHGRCDGSRAHEDTLEAGKTDLPDALFEWADVIIYAALEHKWLFPNWSRLREKRIVWRTIGQSAHPNEWMMRPLHGEGLQIVRYSPKERNIPEFAGEDALIRFYKDPDEWYGWTGEDAVVTSCVQNLFHRSLADDGDLQPPGKQWTSFSFWQGATQGLRTLPMGPGSEVIGGMGKVSYEQMRVGLRSARAYCYTGTQPASYTLGLMEAMMTGIPLVSVPPTWYDILPYGHRMFEGHEIAPLWAETPKDANRMLALLLDAPDHAAEIGAQSRARALDFFDIDKIGAQWQEFLSSAPSQPEPVEADEYRAAFLEAAAA